MKFDSLGRRMLRRVCAASSCVEVAERVRRSGVACTPQYIGLLLRGKNLPGLAIACALKKKCGIEVEAWLKKPTDENLLSPVGHMLERDVADDRAAE